MKKLVLFIIIWLVLLIVPGEVQPASAQGPTPSGAQVGKPWRGAPGIKETVAQIMERGKNAPRRDFSRVQARPIRVLRNVQRRENPSAPNTSQFPASTRTTTPFRSIPQTIGVNFRALSGIADSIPWIPPDTMAAVGPTQIVAEANGRVKVFDKTGVLGSLDVDMNVFWNSVRNGTDAFDSHVRYDRLSGRWFLTAINDAAVGANRILIAVSSSSVITSTDTSSFTFFQFQQDQVGPTPNADTGFFADYDTLGVDTSALYVGVNVFNGNTFTGATGFVVKKSDLLNGILTVTAFRQIADNTGAGIYTPQGVDNDDPQSTEGYFIGPDESGSGGVLVMRRISTPGGTPSISENLNITVPTTVSPIDVPAKGSSLSLDALDDRLFAAMIHQNKITGAKSLWTAHNIEVNSSGIAAGGGGRNGSRWYEIINFTTVPTLNQSGTLYDSAVTNPRSYWIPSVAMSGQGHMALGASFASANDFPGVVVAGRFFSDPLGTIQSPTIAQTGVATYTNNVSCSGDPFCGKRWGDYSQTVVDPNDDMTMWTVQEYSNSSASVDWATRVVQLLAPPPATVSNLVPSSAPQGQVSFSVTVTGTSTSGSGWFDPGSDAGGPGFRNHISARVTGGVIVNSVTFNSPTQLTINVATFCANTGAQDVIITNPDGQSMTASGVLTITSAPTTCHQYIFPLIYR